MVKDPHCYQLTDKKSKVRVLSTLKRLHIEASVFDIVSLGIHFKTLKNDLGSFLRSIICHEIFTKLYLWVVYPKET